MFKLLNESLKHRMLILNYNTFIIQSTGFLRYMAQDLGVPHVLSDLDEYDFLRTTLQFADRNTAKIVDPNISNEFYLNFITDKFMDITNKSTPSSMLAMIRILMMQQFVEAMYIASPNEFVRTSDDPLTDGNAFHDDVQCVFFNIFDTQEVLKFIKENDINTLWLDDSSMLLEILADQEIDHSKMTYILSKIGYNMTDDEEAMHMKHPEIVALRLVLKFEFGIVDLVAPPHDTDEDIFTHQHTRT